MCWTVYSYFPEIILSKNLQFEQLTMCTKFVILKEVLPVSFAKLLNHSLSG